MTCPHVFLVVARLSLSDHRTITTVAFIQWTAGIGCYLCLVHSALLFMPLLSVVYVRSTWALFVVKSSPMQPAIGGKTLACHSVHGNISSPSSDVGLSAIENTTEVFCTYSCCVQSVLTEHVLVVTPISLRHLAC